MCGTSSATVLSGDPRAQLDERALELRVGRPLLGQGARGHGGLGLEAGPVDRAPPRRVVARRGEPKPGAVGARDDRLHGDGLALELEVARRVPAFAQDAERHLRAGPAADALDRVGERHAGRRGPVDAGDLVAGLDSRTVGGCPLDRRHDAERLVLARALDADADERAADLDLHVPVGVPVEEGRVGVEGAEPALEHRLLDVRELDRGCGLAREARNEDEVAQCVLTVRRRREEEARVAPGRRATVGDRVALGRAGDGERAFRQQLLEAAEGAEAELREVGLDHVHRVGKRGDLGQVLEDGRLPHEVDLDLDARPLVGRHRDRTLPGARALLRDDPVGAGGDVRDNQRGIRAQLADGCFVDPRLDARDGRREREGAGLREGGGRAESLRQDDDDGEAPSSHDWLPGRTWRRQRRHGTPGILPHRAPLHDCGAARRRIAAMRCPACQTENRSGVRFCEECGARLDALCPVCGVSVPSGKKFCGACGAALGAAPTVAEPLAERFATPTAYTPAHLAERILKDRAALSGERKQVTVLFADASGFTSLSGALDPEDLHALINRAFELMLAEVHRYEGTGNQFLGGGLMALFGAPVAHEDHARRAAHAALGMQRVLARYRDELERTRGIDFRMRMGLNTGLVVVGASGGHLRMDYTAVGDTTNTAARAQQLARPGQIVLAEPTERLVRGYVETRALGAIPVKGKSQPVAAYELLEVREGITRLDARAARGLSPLVGRDDALATLERAWAQARTGRGQAVFVVGAAGIAESRLRLESRRRRGETATWIEGDCISFGQSTPFLPIVEMLKRTFGIEDKDTEAQIIAKIHHRTTFLGEDAASVEALLRYLLSVDPGDPSVATLDPVQRRGRIVAAIQRLTAAGSRRRPVVLVAEDAHWMDSASEDFLKSLTQSLPGMAVLLIVTYRPAYQQPFGDRTYHWRIGLQPVDEQDAARIVRATLGVAELPRELAVTIAGKAEGNPFFLEEIGRTLAETGAVRVENGRLVLAQAASTITVPETVQDVIAARLDRLADSQKRTVQTASVIGREFALALLRRLSDLPEQLEQNLTELKRIELIY